MKKFSDGFNIWCVIWRLFAYLVAATLVVLPSVPGAPLPHPGARIPLPVPAEIILIAVIVAVTTVLELFWKSPTKSVVLIVVDFISGFLMLCLYPCFLIGIIFSLPILSAFRLNRSAGGWVVIISLFLFLCGIIILSDGLKSEETLASAPYVPVMLGIMYLVFMIGSLYSNGIRQEERSQALIQLIQVGQELGVSSSLQKVLTMGLNVVKTLFPAHSCVIYMKSAKEEALGEEAIFRVKAYSGPQYFVDFNPEITPSVVGKTIKEKTEQLLGNFSSDPREDVIPKDKGLRSMMLAPLSFEDKTVGAMVVAHTIPDYFTQEDLKLFNMLAIQIALAIRNIQIQETMGTMAVTDSLSGLFTHGFFQENLSTELTKAKYENKPASVMIIDVDFFKKINDSYGHPQGDALLKQLGGVLRSVARKEDILCRYGGDEFTVTMPNTNRISAVILAEKIRTAVEEYEFVLKGQIVHITISGGVGSFPEDSQTKKELVDVADKALYQSKQGGRNKISFGAAKK